MPNSLLEASSKPSAASSRADVPAVILPLAVPAVVAGSIFTFSLTLSDYVAPSSCRTPSSSRTSSTTRSASPAIRHFRRGLGHRFSDDRAVYLFVARRFGAFEAI